MYLTHFLLSIPVLYHRYCYHDLRDISIDMPGGRGGPHSSSRHHPLPYTDSRHPRGPKGTVRDNISLSLSVGVVCAISFEKKRRILKVRSVAVVEILITPRAEGVDTYPPYADVLPRISSAFFLSHRLSAGTLSTVFFFLLF